MGDKTVYPKVAFLFPSLARGGYWQPVLAEFAKKFPKSKVFTGIWEGFLPVYSGRFQVEVVGQTRFIPLPIKNRDGHYPFGVLLPPLSKLLVTLLRDKPDVIFVSGFSLWSFLALILKPVGRWRIVCIYDGSSPSIDRTDVPAVTAWRRLLGRFCDAFVSNTEGGKRYLVQHLRVPSLKVRVHPYEVPDVGLWQNKNPSDLGARFSGVVFLTVGSLIVRKGLIELIEAVKILKQRTQKDFKVLVAGDGPLRPQLEKMITKYRLSGIVELLGHVNYEDLGNVIRASAVFVFPTLEDVWGVAPLEAMAMGKPVLCSKYAGASEVIDEGVNGWVFDPYDVQGLAELMRKFLDNPELASTMGRNAQEKMKSFTPESAAQFLGEVVKAVLGDA